MENWKSIDGFEGLYEVSNLGRVKSLKFGKTKILKPRNCCEYLTVGLYKDGKVKNMLVHRLVAEAFIPNPNKLETVNHRDEDKTNNAAGNLEWLSRADNNNYGTRNKRAAEAHSKQVQQLDKSTGELLAEFPSIIEAARRTSIAQSHIGACCRGQRKSAGGFGWKYVSPCGS